MTRLLVDPATDFDDPAAVTLTATLLDPAPALVRTFEGVIAGTVVDLPAPDAAAAWRLTARRDGRIVTERTVHWTGTDPRTWAALTDVDPATLKQPAGSPLLDIGLDDLRARILGGASAAYDTLKELEDELKGDDTALGGILTTLGTKLDQAAVDARISTRADPAGAAAAVTLAGLGGVPKRAALAPKPATFPVGGYVPVEAAFPALTISANGAATSIVGGTQRVTAIEPFSAGNIQGAYWAAGTVYAAGQVVQLGNDNETWVAVAASTGVTPGTDASKWRRALPDQRIAYVGGSAKAYRTVLAGTGSFTFGAANGFTNPNTQRSITPVVGYYGKAVEFEWQGIGGYVRLTVDGVTDTTGARVLADVVTTVGSATITSATANFTADDVGRRVTLVGQVTGASPVTTGGAYIASVTNATTAVLSANAGATATGVAVRIVGGWKRLPTGGYLVRALVTFPTADHHTVAMEGASEQFLGITASAGDVIHRPPLASLPIAIVQADSVGYGQNSDGTQLETFVQDLGRLMGWDAWSEAIGGSGFANPGPIGNGSDTYANRIPRCAAYAPDVLIAAGGLNDQASAGYTAAQVTSSMAAWITAAKAALPNALLVIVGPFFTTDTTGDVTNTASTKAVRDAQLAAVAALPGYGYDTVGQYGRAGNVIYVDTYPTWLVGKWTSGGTDSASALLSADTIHPLRRGHRYYAKRIAATLQAALTGSGLV